MLAFTFDSLQNNRSYFSQAVKEKNIVLKQRLSLWQLGWSRSIQQFPMCKHLLGLLALPALCSSQVLSRSWACPTRRGLGHLHMRSYWEEMRNLDKALLHHQVPGTWEQNVGISPFMPLYKEQQGGTKSCKLTTEQHVLHFCSSQQILNKVQLRLGLQQLIPLWEQRDPKLLS